MESAECLEASWREVTDGNICHSVVTLGRGDVFWQWGSGKVSHRLRRLGGGAERTHGARAAGCGRQGRRGAAEGLLSWGEVGPLQRFLNPVFGSRHRLEECTERKCRTFIQSLLCTWFFHISQFTELFINFPVFPHRNCFHFQGGETKGLGR